MEGAKLFIKAYRKEHVGTHKLALVLIDGEDQTFRRQTNLTVEVVGCISIAKPDLESSSVYLQYSIGDPGLEQRITPLNP